MNLRLSIWLQNDLWGIVVNVNDIPKREHQIVATIWLLRSFGLFFVIKKVNSVDLLGKKDQSSLLPKDLKQSLEEI